ncbi:MAG: C2H2-type zinc finger protein [Dehalococcoidia bacterium]|nr:C2H2-type zinc finger protein [Dehalococcoidia bacterium]
MADYQCPICNEKFTSLERLEAHEQEHHHAQGNEARPLAEERQREPETGPAAGPGGNPVIDTRTGEIESR